MKAGQRVRHIYRGVGTVVRAGVTISRVRFGGRKVIACWNDDLTTI
jgi:hypothetical protein